MKDKKFATVVNCMDGRVQDAVNDYLRKTYHVDFVDTITEAGPVAALANASENAEIVKSVQKRVEVSTDKHFSHLVAVVAHHDCAGNPVDDAEQILQLAAALETIKSMAAHRAKCVGLWVDEKWRVNELNKLKSLQIAKTNDKVSLCRR
jgi:hypothetical protein